MPKDKPFRELQFSSAQLIIVFLAILVLGVFIFLLGISVGKKQAQLTAGPGTGRGLKSETVASKAPKPAEAFPAGSGTQPAGAVPEIAKSGETAVQTAKPEPSGAKKPESPAGAKSENAKPASSPSGKPADKPAVKVPETKVDAAPEAKTKPADTTTIPAAVKKPGSKTAEAPKGRFYVQVGAVTDKPAAKGFADKVEQLGFPAAVLDPLGTDKRTVFRVRVGPYDTKTEADDAQGKLAAALKKKKTDFFIVKD